MTITKFIPGHYAKLKTGSKFFMAGGGIQVKLSFCNDQNGDVECTVVEKKILERKQCFYGVAGHERNLG